MNRRRAHAHRASCQVHLVTSPCSHSVIPTPPDSTGPWREPLGGAGCVRQPCLGTRREERGRWKDPRAAERPVLSWCSLSHGWF